MRRYLFVLLSLGTFLYGSAQKREYNPELRFTVTELKKDFQYLRTQLTKHHPNLYLYTPKASMTAFLDSLEKSITQPLTEREFYNKILLLNAKIKDGHTMFLPSDDAIIFHNSQSRFFPFYILISGHSLFITMNCSSDTSLKQGTEIRSINGTAAADIIDFLSERQIRDGYNQTYPLWILNTYFKDYYSFSYGHPKEFSIVYRENGEDHQRIVRALPRDSVRYFKLLRYPSSEDYRGIRLERWKDLTAAMLVIPSFDEDISKNRYNQDFKKTIQAIFDTIQSEHITQLVLDLRNNQGGDFENGVRLIANLFQKPFRYLLEGDVTGVQQPVKKPFTGKLYVLINGGSFSNSGIVCSVLQSQQRGIFIGEETGGNKTIISGDAGDGLLPNTHINCQVSSKKYLIRSTPNDGHGTIPDYPVIISIADWGTDPVKQQAIKLIAH